jgi:tetratricopeptide (TPR) repeat protein
MRHAAFSGILAFPVLLMAQAAQAPETRDLRYEKDTATVAVRPAPSIPRSYARVIGISRDKTLPEEAQLQFPDRDAKEIYTALISAEAGQFPAENVHTLIGPAATFANMRKELETWLPSVAKPDDRVLIYFAGHGFISGGKAYLAPYDIDRQNIQGTSYPMETLGNVIGTRIHAKWKVLLTDSCHSGAITPEADRQQINQTLLDLNRSLFSLTASRDREQSFESAQWGGGHGVFTYYVIKGLQGEADTSGDGVVTADELAEYVHTNVRDATGQRQNPTSERGSFDPEMVLAFNPGRTHVSTKTSSQFGTFVIETNRDGVEVFLDGISQGVVNKAAPLRLPGITPGPHTIQGVHLGYEPDGPRQETVYPGQDTAISIRINIVRRRSSAATDAFDKGLAYYNKGAKENYARAVEDFRRALNADPNYSQAALYAARAYNALFDEENADKYFRRAIEIDPDYSEARASYGGMLLDRGDFDSAIRQLNAAVQKEPSMAMAWYLLSVAFARKDAYPESIRAAREAIRLAPGNAEAHFWLAESLRLTKNWQESMSEYRRYLDLSDFESGLGGKLDYYVIGSLFGVGRRKRAAQADIWREMRSEANFGLCDSAAQLKQFTEAIAFCQQALVYDPEDPFAHYRLGVNYSEQYNLSGGAGLLAAARRHFDEVLTLSPDTSEAEKAKKYIGNIDQVLAAKQR